MDLGADTIVLIGNKILGKPSSRDEARSMLHLLSGERHRVITGFCILDPSGSLSHSESVATLVRVKSLSGQEIDAYMRPVSPLARRGATPSGRGVLYRGIHSGPTPMWWDCPYAH